MKFTATLASVAVLAASVAAQGAVDPAKLPKGWCMIYTESACKEAVAPATCGANATMVSNCVSTFSMDKVCTSFEISCACTPLAGGAQKDISELALNKTFELMPYGMCANLIPANATSGLGLVSNGYKPDGKRPNATAANPSATGGAAGGKATETPKSGASALQMAIPTVALAVLSLGMAIL